MPADLPEPGHNARSLRPVRRQISLSLRRRDGLLDSPDRLADADTQPLQVVLHFFTGHALVAGVNELEEPFPRKVRVFVEISHRHYLCWVFFKRASTFRLSRFWALLTSFTVTSRMIAMSAGLVMPEFRHSKISSTSLSLLIASRIAPCNRRTASRPMAPST